MNNEYFVVTCPKCKSNDVKLIIYFEQITAECKECGYKGDIW